MAKVLVPLAQGCEELEAVTIIDLLRRAGIDVVVAGLDSRAVKCARGTIIMPDMNLDRALHQEYDMVALPGGTSGAELLKKDSRIKALLQKMAGQNKFTAAICAAPMVLAEAGLLKYKKATGYPGTLEGADDVILKEDAVVKDGKIITSRGPGTAMDFALELIETLLGEDKKDEIESALQRPRFDMPAPRASSTGQPANPPIV